MKPGIAISALPAPAAEPPRSAATDVAPGAAAGGRLWLALHVPGLPVSALDPAASDSPPWAVSVHEGRKPRLLGVSARARAAGVCEGMEVTAATVICPLLRVHRHDPLHEAAALEGLAAWCGNYTSQVSLQPPRGLVLEIGASLRLFGGLEALLERMRGGLRALGHEATEGIAPTPAAAWLLAGAGAAAPVMTAARLAGALAPVPVTCMDLPARMVCDLQALGACTFGDCARLPRDGLARRFGPGLLNLLDRALGRSADPRAWWTPAPRFERRLDLAFESADRGVLLHAARRLLHELGGFLCARACAAGALELQLAHRHGPATRITLQLVSASRDPSHLLMLVAERLERVPIDREVIHLGLRVVHLVPFVASTGDLYAPAGAGRPPRQAADAAEALVERLGARLGRDAVHGLVRVAEHRPEYASAEPAWHRRTAHPGAACEPDPDPGMPLWLLPRPRRLDGAVAGVDGPLRLEQGPWRIESGWWDGRDVARDYYVARSARGTRYWVFRERREPRHWFVHGLFA